MSKPAQRILGDMPVTYVVGHALLVVIKAVCHIPVHPDDPITDGQACLTACMARPSAWHANTCLTAFRSLWLQPCSKHQCDDLPLLLAMLATRIACHPDLDACTHTVASTAVGHRKFRTLALLDAWLLFMRYISRLSTDQGVPTEHSAHTAPEKQQASKHLLLCLRQLSWQQSTLECFDIASPIEGQRRGEACSAPGCC